MVHIRHRLILAFVGSFALLMFAKQLTPYLYRVYSSAQYLGVHTFLEFISLFIAFSTFLLVWLLKRGFEDQRGRFLVALGSTLLGVGYIDLFHTLSFLHGMPAFITPSSYQKATFLWLFGRYCIVAGFFAAFGVLRTKTRCMTDSLFYRLLIIINFVIVTAGTLFSTYYLQLIPPLFVEGVGLTPLKINLEYLLILCFALTLVLLHQHRAQLKETLYANLGYFLIFSLTSEAAFTFYKNVYDTYNLIGHLYKIIAYGFLFRAIYLSGIIDHLSTLSEMGKMSAQILTNRGSITNLLEIQMQKLKHLIPHAQRIVFYVKEDGDLYHSDYVWGKYSEVLPVHGRIRFSNLFNLLGQDIKLYDDPYHLLDKLTPEDYTAEIATVWIRTNQLLYVPLILDDQFYGCIMLFTFGRLSRFSDADLEKVAIFQLFAALAIAHLKYGETISRLSYEDSMTKLPNRRYFFDQLTEAQYETARYNIPFTLIFLDMNGLKQINDDYGHAAGDEALKTIGELLKSTVRKTDIAARLGGDEFGIIVKHADLADGRKKITELREHFSQIPLPSYNVFFSLAVGGANYPAEASTSEALLKLADDRMYAHKRKIKAAAQNPLRLDP